MEINLYKIMQIYDQEISKRVKNKKKLYHFERNKMININNIYNILNNIDNYEIIYNIFTITEPKKRIILSLNITDKIINHYFVRNCLDLKLERYFDIRNVATRKNLGTSYGRFLVNKYLEEMKKYNIFYILKIDIKGYFYNIDHDVLKSMLINILDDYEYKILCKIIDSTNQKHIRDETGYYDDNKGLPIGSMTSQILAIYYLNKVDHLIVNKYHLRMVRYMDDFIIFGEEKSYLKFILNKIIDILRVEYKLEVNSKKTFITRSDVGFNFLGYNYRVNNKKTIISISNSSKRRIKNNLRNKRNLYFKGKIELNSYVSMINNYIYSFKVNINKK